MGTFMKAALIIWDVVAAFYAGIKWTVHMIVHGEMQEPGKFSDRLKSFTESMKADD